MSEHILSVSNDESLLATGELLLRSKGYEVTSALGFADGAKKCQDGKFDLFILGHSIADSDKRELIRVFRQHCGAPVLALRRHGENVPDGADEHAYPQDIEDMLKKIIAIIPRPKTKKSKN